jgi:hypothetical protein
MIPGKMKLGIYKMDKELREKIDDILLKHGCDRFEIHIARDEILALIKEAGYVKLAENQELPLVLIDFEAGIGANIEATKEIMLNAGFRKIEKEVTNE